MRDPFGRLAVAALLLSIPAGVAAETPGPSPTPAASASPEATSLTATSDDDSRARIIDVHLENGVASPNVVSVNLQTGDTLVLQVHNNGNAAYSANACVTLRGRTRCVRGNHLHLGFLNCKSKLAGRALQQDLKRRRERGEFCVQDTCPYFIKSHDGSSMTVLAEASKDKEAAHIVVSGPGLNPVSAGIVVRLVRRSWGLSFSSGLGVPFYPRDDRYALEPVNDTESHIQKVSPGGLPYTIATFAHYDRIGYPLALSMGVSTKVPADDLSVLAGLSYKIRTLPIGKSGYLTVGAALTSVSRLGPDFEKAFAADRSLPANTPVASLTEKRREVGIFVAFTFCFAGGGEDEFAKRVSGR